MLSEQAPTLSRGEPGHGNQGILLTQEERGLPYLLRLRQIKKRATPGGPADQATPHLTPRRGSSKRSNRDPWGCGLR